jgi:hypothetical protein
VLAKVIKKHLLLILKQSEAFYNTSVKVEDLFQLANQNQVIKLTLHRYAMRDIYSLQLTQQKVNNVEARRASPHPINIAKSE